MENKMKQFLSVILATVALSATAFAQDEGDSLPAGTRTAAFVVVQATDGSRSVYKIPADVAASQDHSAVAAAAVPANLVQANMVADEGDMDGSRPAWFWCWNTYNFGWGGYGGGYGGYYGYSHWYTPSYNWYNSGYNYWVYRWSW